MARVTKPLTNTEVNQAKPRDKEYNLIDGEGLMLRVKPTGTKSWLFNYYHPITKKRKNYSIGLYPTITIIDARKIRLELKRLISNGIDPKESKDAETRIAQVATSQTLRLIAESWFDVKKTKIAETTSRSLWRNFENHLFPKLGHIAISQINAPETINVLKPLAAKGTLETTDKIIGHLNEVMTFAVNTGIIHHNPLAGIKAAFQTPKAVNMPTLKPEELPELIDKLSYASIKITTRCLIEWQLHTMVRPSEASGIEWEEIDFENNLWRIPANRMKKKKEHIVPLTKQTLAILNRMKPISGHRKFVFPSDRDTSKPSNSQTANMALKRMGFEGRLVAHGMRALASTTLNEKGFDADIIEAALAHSDKNEIRRAYNRAEYIERRRDLMSWWSEHIEKAKNKF
jgi:integrase